jgi:hypothetical protein
VTQGAPARSARRPTAIPPRAWRRTARRS